MAQILISKVQVRRGQEQQTGIPRLDPGEFGWAEDTENLYIGKRIAEGAVDDENTRILTQNDLDNIFSLIQPNGNGAGSTSYTYRADSQYIDATTSTVATKLDNWVSLTDYDPALSPSFHQSQGYDITQALGAAISHLYLQDGQQGYNTFVRQDSRRRLIIPAGNYTIAGSPDGSTSLTLPPYTTLVGEGPGMTTLTFYPTSDNDVLFRTADAQGNNFDHGPDPMDAGAPYGLNAKQIKIENMTLLFTSTNVYNAAMISLDQIAGAEIHNVDFGTAGLVTATIYGTAIQIRGDSVDATLLDTAPLSNIRIDNCQFHNIGSAIQQTQGTLNRFFITNNIFTRLQSGITMYSPLLNRPGPVNGVIDSNRFERISQSAILLGTATTSIFAYPGYTVSSNNTFIGVGNGTDILSSQITDYTTSTGVPVLVFNSDGNKSVNDSFGRKDVAFTETLTANSNFYYVPYISGPGAIEDQSVYRRELSDLTNPLIPLPLNGQEQSLEMKYELWNKNTGYSRKGTLLINIIGLGTGYPAYVNGDQIGSVSDYYNYSYSVEVTDATFDIDTTFAADYNYVTLRVLGFDPADVLGPPLGNGPYYIDYQINQIS